MVLSGLRLVFSSARLGLYWAVEFLLAVNKDVFFLAVLVLRPRGFAWLLDSALVVVLLLLLAQMATIYFLRL